MPAMTSTSGTAKETRPPSPGTDREFTVSEWKPYAKNTLCGFLTITMPSGMVLHGCSLHEKNESRWIGLPSQKFVKDDGSSSYTPIVEFTTKEARDRFGATALRAIDRFLASPGGTL